MNIEQAKKEFQNLEKKYSRLIWDLIKEKNKELSKLLADEMNSVIEKYDADYVGPGWFAEYENDPEKGINEYLEGVNGKHSNKNILVDQAKMFISNELIEAAIANDHSGDWDGGNRANDFYKGIIKKGLILNK